MKDRLYLGLAIGVGACLIVVGGWYIYNSKFSDTAKLENCADNKFIYYRMTDGSGSDYKSNTKKIKEKRIKQIKWKSLKYKLGLYSYRIAFNAHCQKEFKRSPHAFRLDY